MKEGEDHINLNYIPCGKQVPMLCVMHLQREWGMDSAVAALLLLLAAGLGTGRQDFVEEKV